MMRPAAAAVGGAAQMLGPTDEEFVEAIRALAERGMVEITRDVDTDVVRVGLTEAGWQVLEERAT